MSLSFLSHSLALSMISLAGGKPVPWKTLGVIIPGFRMAWTGLRPPRTVSTMQRAAIIPISSESTWG